MFDARQTNGDTRLLSSSTEHRARLRADWLVSSTSFLTARAQLDSHAENAAGRDDEFDENFHFGPIFARRSDAFLRLSVESQRTNDSMRLDIDELPLPTSTARSQSSQSIDEHRSLPFASDAFAPPEEMVEEV